MAQSRWKTMNKRNIMMNCSTLVLALSLMLCLMTACGKKKQNTSLQWVNVVELTPTEGTAIASYPAKTEAMHITDLAFRVLGTIEQVLVKEGDPVTAGQVVARLYERDYSTQLRATEAEYRQISAECERVAEMYKDRAVSDNNYDKARYGLQQITEKLTNHRNQLADCVLRAPFDGYVNEIYKHKIETVAPGQPILSVYSSNGVEVVIHIPERAYAQRKPDDTYTVTFGSLPGRSFPLTVRSAATMANDNHLYEMHLVLKENVPEITPGMSAMVEVSHKQDANDGIKVPTGAVWTEEQKSFVFVYDKKDSTVKKTTVKVERLESDGYMTISEGLKEGCQIVASGVHHLTDGQKVRVHEKASNLNAGNLK